MGLHETDCTSLTSLTCPREDSWTLKLVNPITGKTIHECAVADESDWLQIRRDAYSRAPKEESCKIKYVVGQNVVPTGKTIKNVGLHGVTKVDVAYCTKAKKSRHNKNCPLCRKPHHDGEDLWHQKVRLDKATNRLHKEKMHNET